MGDWGQANFHRILCWLSQEINDRTEPGSLVYIRNGIGGADAMAAVMNRDVDLAIGTPAGFGRMAMAGLGPFQGQPTTHLRALAVLPQDDRLVFAIDKDLGVTAVEQIAQRRLPLRVLVSKRDNVNFIGLAAMKLFEACGLDSASLSLWGGRFIEYERPEQCLAAMERGEADAIAQEAIMTPGWLELLKSRNLAILPWSEESLHRVQTDLLWHRAPLRAGYFPGQDAELQVLDFADFQIMVHADFPEDLAHLITWCLCNTSRVVERHYRSFPKDRTPMSYPLEPVQMARTTIPLHPGARRCYEEGGHIAHPVA
jgi:TRAP-type uncharacterized transport system substrate-binding protein